MVWRRWLGGGRSLRLLFMFFLVLLLLAATTFNSPAAPRQKRITTTMYFVGDSLTAGRSATALKYSYRARLITYLEQERHLTVAETGMWKGGWRVADALTAVRLDPPSADTSIIVVEIGTNDASGSFNSQRVTNPAVFAAKYTQLIEELQAAAPHAAFVCVSTWWTSALATSYNNAIARACPDGKYVDITSMFDNDAYHGPANLDESWYTLGWRTDTYHPNNAGMAAIARSVEARMP